MKYCIALVNNTFLFKLGLDAILLVGPSTTTRSALIRLIRET
jgi:hypothetical protein